MPKDQPEAKTQAQQVYAYLKNAIYNCKYLPGQEISEKQLYAELDFGRTPIRETLLQLQKEELVEIYPRRGMRIAPITDVLINDLYQTRRVIEPSVAVSHCSLYPKRKLMEYERLLSKSAEMSDSAFYSLDIEFHTFLVATAGNGMLTSIFTNLMWHQYRLAIYAAMLHKNKREFNDPEHQRIVTALLEENAEEIRTSITHHINSSMIASFKSLEP